MYKKGSDYIKEWSYVDNRMAYLKLDTEPVEAYKMGLIYSGYGNDDVESWRMVGPKTVEYSLYNGSKFLYTYPENSFRYLSESTTEEGDVDEERLKEKLGNNIRSVLSEKGLTQGVLARETGISPMSINKYLNGVTAPGFISLYKIAKFLGRTIDELVS